MRTTSLSLLKHSVIILHSTRVRNLQPLLEQFITILHITHRREQVQATSLNNSEASAQRAIMHSSVERTDLAHMRALAFGDSTPTWVQGGTPYGR